MAANQQNEESPDDSSQEQSLTSMEDTGESPSLQEQEAAPPENNDAAVSAKKKRLEAGNAPIGSAQRAEIELSRYLQDMNDYLAWKESMRITSVDLQIGGPFFNLWTKEANLFFRRLVIIKKRSERVKKQQRA